MEENFDALEVIAHTRGKVEMDDRPSGGWLFPLWGWLTFFFYLCEFVLWQVFQREWCLWLWMGIPLMGIPLMTFILRKDHERTHMRTRRSKLVLDYWIFAACAIGIGGTVFGFAGIYEVAENPLICLLVGIGAFLTGEEARFRPMILGGIAGAAVGVGAFLLKGELWTWQLLCVVLTALTALIIPGHLYKKTIGNGV